MSRVRILSAAVAATGFVMLTASAAVAADAASGEEAFTNIGCWTCHGTVGQGGRGPAIAPNPMPLAAFVAYVRMPPLGMPPFRAAILSGAQLEDIHAYLESIPPPRDVESTILAE